MKYAFHVRVDRVVRLVGVLVIPLGSTDGVEGTLRPVHIVEASERRQQDRES
jgi:hypothetical protein